MTTVNVYYHPASLEHKLYPFFSEKPRRLKKLTQIFNELSLPVQAAPAAAMADVTRAHAADYIAHVKSLSEKGFVSGVAAQLNSPMVQWYTRVSPGSYEAALHAAGGVVQAVDDTLSGKCVRAFCAARPPGHHAGVSRGEGFCLFNNVAIGALHALDSGAKKVAIIDFDRHHGNGTQEIVEKFGQGRVMLVSSYQEGCKYGPEQGEGQLVNGVLPLPIPQHSDFSTVEALYRDKVIPTLKEFKPDLILISAGFDMHKADPLTNLKLTEQDYGKLTRMLVSAADELCGGRVVSSLEGGYEVKALRNCVKEHLKALI
jgi:acetoin utilization deacetylase AcuC-like enzyme